MNDGEALLRNILLNPADDMARLIYADWLDDNGDTGHATLIRHGHVHRGYLFACNMPHRVSARGSRYNGKWTAGNGKPNFRGATAAINRILPPAPCDSWFQVVFSRGFISAISCTGAEFAKHARTLFSQHPIERVKLTDATLSSGFARSFRYGTYEFNGEFSCYSHNIDFLIPIIRTLDQRLDPDEQVSQGAVIYGRLLAGLTRSFPPTISNPLPV